jgi:hypothetical protein
MGGAGTEYDMFPIFRKTAPPAVSQIRSNFLQRFRTDLLTASPGTDHIQRWLRAFKSGASSFRQESEISQYFFDGGGRL